MTLTDIHTPTPEEIDAQIRAAHQARALAVHDWVQTAARWFARPHLGHRTA